MSSPGDLRGGELCDEYIGEVLPFSGTDDKGRWYISGALLSGRHWIATDEESGVSTPFTRVRLAAAGRSVKVDVPRRTPSPDQSRPSGR